MARPSYSDSGLHAIESNPRSSAGTGLSHDCAYPSFRARRSFSTAFRRAFVSRTPSAIGDRTWHGMARGAGRNALARAAAERTPAEMPLPLDRLRHRARLQSPFADPQSSLANPQSPARRPTPPLPKWKPGGLFGHPFKTRLRPHARANPPVRLRRIRNPPEHHPRRRILR